MTSSIFSSTHTNGVLIAAHFILFAGLLVVALAIPRNGFVMVVTDPRQPADNMIRVIGAAGGSFVSGGSTSWLAVAYSDDPGFAGRLMKAGAFLVLNHALAVGCQQGVGT